MRCADHPLRGVIPSVFIRVWPFGHKHRTSSGFISTQHFTQPELPQVRNSVFYCKHSYCKETLHYNIYIIMRVYSACALNILINCMLHCLIAIGCLYIPRYTVHSIVKATLPSLRTVHLPLHNMNRHGQWREITDCNRRTDGLRFTVIINGPLDVTAYGSDTPWRHSQTVL